MKQVTLDDNKKPRFTPKYPEKYMGDANSIFIRSTWEAFAFDFCDKNKNILKWSSEEIVIPYLKPILGRGGMDMKPARYFPDLYVEYIDRNGIVRKELIEIKPKKQARLSKARNTTTKAYENYVYMVNMAKWDAAKKWCDSRGIKFSLMTEDSMSFGKK